MLKVRARLVFFLLLVFLFFYSEYHFKTILPTLVLQRSASLRPEAFIKGTEALRSQLPEDFYYRSNPFVIALFVSDG